MPPRHFMTDKKHKRTVENKVLWKWLLSYLSDFKIQFWILTGLLFVFTAFQAVLPILQGELINEGLKKDNKTVTLIILGIYAVLRIGSTIGNSIVEFKMAKIGTEVVYDVRDEIFKSLQDTSMDYFDKAYSGDIISIATNDVDQLNQIFGGQIAMMVSDLFRGVLVIILMLYYNWELALISFLLVPVFLVLSRVFMKKVRKGFRLTRKKISHVTSVAEQNISGMKVIQAYGKQQSAAKEFDKANRANQQTLLKVRKVLSFFIPLIFLLSSIWGALIMMYGGLGVLEGVTLLGNPIDIGTVSTFNDYLFQLLMPMFMIAMFSQLAESMLAAAERVYKLLNTEKSIPDPENPKSISNVQGKIEFQDVTFKYAARETQEQLAETFAIEAEKKFKNNNIKKHEKQSKESPKSNDFDHILKNPDMIMKLARHLDRQIKGETHGIQMGSGGGGGGGSGESMGGGVAGGGRMMGGEMDPSKLPRNLILQILGSPKVPSRIFEQFSPTIQALIKEDREIREHEKQKGDIIKNVSFSVQPSQTVAIVGPTGAGKTTLIKLIARFYDLEEGKGKILLDNIDIRNFKKSDLRKVIGMVPQDNFLFSGTILENLYYGVEDKDANMEISDELLKITNFLGLHNFIKNMPDGYHTELKENAANISVGQRQLIAFARVLMNDPQILILDEATSAVDPYTESLIQQALEKAKVGRTTIIIAHRLSTIKNADEIFVLDNGQIVEHGSHNSLLEKNGHYANLVEMQAQDIV